MTCEEWLSSWLSLRAGGLRPRTIDCYTGLIQRHIVPAIGSVELTELTPFQVSAMLAAIAATGHHRTAEQVYVLLKAALKSAALLQWLPRSPIDAVMRPAHTPRPGSAWTPEESRVYFAAAMRHPHKMAWLMALVFGLRRGEILGLHWSDIDLRTRRIHIRRQLVMLANGKLIEQPPKTAAGVRTLAIPPEVLPQIRKCYQFGDTRIVNLTPNGLDCAHRALLSNLNVPYIRLHDLRHTMATNALRGGASMRALSDVLGHSDPSVTTRFYTHPDEILLANTIAAAALAVL